MLNSNHIKVNPENTPKNAECGEKITEEEANRIYFELFKSNSQEAASFNNLVGDVDFNRELVNGWLTGIGRSDLITATPEPVQAAEPKKPKAEKKPAKSKQPHTDPQPAAEDLQLQEPEPDDTQSEEEYTTEELKEICGKIAEFSLSSMTAGQFMKITTTHKDKRTVNEWLKNNDCGRFIPRDKTAEPEPVNIELDQIDKDVQAIALHDRIETSKDRINKLTDESAKAKLNEELASLETETDPSKLTDLLYNLSLNICSQEDKENEAEQVETELPDESAALQDPDNLAAFLGTPNSELNNIEVEPLDTSKAEEQNNEEIAIEKEAEAIYQSGKALEYMIDTCQKLHTGDKIPMIGMILSYAATRVLNSKGIHIFITGKAGSGKSHCTETVYKILPNGKALTARLSDKALFRYEDLKPETVIIIDDQSMTSTFGEIFKNATTDWNFKAEYLVSEKENGQWVSKLRQMPERCPYWYIKANYTGDEQTRDRQLQFTVRNDETQLKAIRNMQNAAAINPDIKKDEHPIRVCKKIWEYVEHQIVTIPYANDIVCKNLEKTRVYNIMLELICSFAILSASKRSKDENGYIIANIEDFKNTCRILNSEEGDQNESLGPEAKELLAGLRTLPSGDYPFKYIRELFKFSPARLTYALHGRDKENPEIGGLCSLAQVGTRQTGRENTIEWNTEIDKELFGENFSLFSMDEDKLQYWTNLEIERNKDSLQYWIDDTKQDPKL